MAIPDYQTVMLKMVEWRTLKTLYIEKRYEKVVFEYSRLKPFLNDQPQFLFEYAQSLNKIGKFKKSILVLNRLALVSGKDYYDECKLKQYADSVIKKKPKVNSIAVSFMKSEFSRLLLNEAKTD